MKVGCVVFILSAPDNGRIPRRAVITGETKTCWKVNDNTFYKSNLRLRGHSKYLFNWFYITPSDDVLEETYKLRKLREKISGEFQDALWLGVSSDKLAELSVAINDYLIKNR